MHSAEAILDVARSFLPRARKLIGRREAYRLRLLVRRADRGEDVTDELYELLLRHEETRTLLGVQARASRSVHRARASGAARERQILRWPRLRFRRRTEAFEDQLFEAARVDQDVQEIRVSLPDDALPGYKSYEELELDDDGAGGEAETTAAGSVPQAPPPPDPPRSAYGLLSCPESVQVGQTFELVVGLSEKQQPGVAGGEMKRPETSVGPYTMVVQVAADGLELPATESWRQELHVTAEAPYPHVILHPTALPQDDPERDTRVEASYSVDGQTIGLAVRALRVSTGPIAAPELQPAATGVNLAIPSAETAPDLTIEIRIWKSDSGGRLRWNVVSPYNITVPDGTESDIGNDPKSFAKDIVVGMNGVEGSEGLYLELQGFARTIRDNIPPAVWQAIRAAAEHAKGRPPTILILSQEPYVPWELAVVDPPLSDEAPPFLSSQAVVGRWVLAENRPPPNPPADVDVTEMAVIWGVYDKTPGWSRLLHAEEEAKDLVEKYKASYKATGVEAASSPVIQCLQGHPAADILHFSVHGKYDPTGIQQGLALVDRKFLSPMQVKGSDLPRAPFVFLNACQVGSGEAILGDYAGMASSFLYAGAAAVIAPLWSIDDGIAKTIAESFYEAALEHGAPAAEAIFRERQAFATTDKTSGTYLAYQFFGHPLLRLTAA